LKIKFLLKIGSKILFALACKTAKVQEVFLNFEARETAERRGDKFLAAAFKRFETVIA
jgi:hypothetical protein